MLFGFDIALTEALSLGVKGRRAGFESFSDGTGLDRVRSQVPSERPDGRDPGFTVITTGNLVVHGFGLNLKFAHGPAPRREDRRRSSLAHHRERIRRNDERVEAP